MFNHKIKEIWENDIKNSVAAVDLWNEKADYFGSYNLEEVQNDRFVEIIREKNLIDKDAIILDVGCGAGKYCTALADDCFKAIGTDLSPKMIESARRKALEYSKKNVEFRCDDWLKLDIEKEGLLHKFDLVMACMTPAICNYETFKKFIDCGKNAGIFCSGTRRTDSVNDELDKILGIKKTKRNSEDAVLYAFNILWERGYYPNIEYVDQSWDSQENIEKAFKVYVNRFKSKYNINESQETVIRRYLEDISEDGIVYEKINTVKAILYWKNN
ncbi:MAG: hypothetical protein Q606_CBAC00007G0008 [Intestinibacter bartlettii DORA_8_9]|uniref:Mg-protoporphyrin IX methyl transferase n=1 Tax=Intestinibacter bartlettii TaxID=261299 RepID=A0A6N3C1T4_9FIRM|nr:MAG: hypothetical protein Q606_CBAC00007G0008 [Intestinibacter bartlettii DORA_8_9]